MTPSDPLDKLDEILDEFGNFCFNSRLVTDNGRAFDRAKRAILQLITEAEIKGHRNELRYGKV